MQRFQYKVIPAPRRGEKAKGAKTTEERFAVAMTRMMNELGAEGWDYVRADTLPCDERAGLTGTKTTYQNVLVFRRPLEVAEAAIEPPKSTLEPIRVDAPLPETPKRILGAAVPDLGNAPKVGGAKHELAAE